ncbi:hypothetical protein [Acinetobacter sp.]|uniref:hypothetical protein n=1 Tax=Acinetobacter sp. TaxID=472 RepID=UPI0031DD0F28
MKQLDFSRIPEKYQELLKKILDLPLVKEELALLKQSCVQHPRVELEATYEGYTLVSIPHANIWLLNLPDGAWKEAFIGYDEHYTKTVLKDYNFLEVCQTYIRRFGKMLPIYI